MPPTADSPGLGARPLGPPPFSPGTEEAAVGRMEVVVAVVAFPPVLPVLFAELDPVADPLPEADPDWLAELGAEVMVVELLLEHG